MHSKKIRTNITTVYLQDSGRKTSLLTDRKFSLLLDSAIKVFENFLLKSKFVATAESIEYNLSFCGKAKIKSLNQQYLSKDKVTDVLSFPLNDFYHENDNAHSHINLGDIFICKEVAYQQSVEFNISYNQELIQLFVHGLLHLFGLDHELSKKEEREMVQLEQKFIKMIYRK